MAREDPSVRTSQYCPLCHSPVRLFYINLYEKLLMCENTYCQYPFGYELPQVFTPGQDMSEDEGIGTQSQSKPADTTEDIASISSDKTWSESDKLIHVLDDDSQPMKTFNNKPPKGKVDEDQLFTNIDDIKEINVELSSLNEELSAARQKEDGCTIKNEKWIKKLKNLQERSGVKLLKPDEMGLLKKDPQIGLGELKIDIGPVNVSTVPSIRIEIHNTNE